MFHPDKCHARVISKNKGFLYVQCNNDKVKNSDFCSCHSQRIDTNLGINNNKSIYKWEQEGLYTDPILNDSIKKKQRKRYQQYFINNIYPSLPEYKVLKIMVNDIPTLVMIDKYENVYTSEGKLLGKLKENLNLPD